MGGVPSEQDERARSAAARAAVERVEPGMTIGLGSGRAVWRVIEMLVERFGERPPVRAAFASGLTEERARAAGIERVELDGHRRLDLAIDGADEVGPGLALVKGGGGALLREKIVIAAAARFVVVAETPKRVDRLGARRPLPVEVIRFGWPETLRRIDALLPDASLRSGSDGPFVTDEGHYLVDAPIPDEADPAALASGLKRLVGVVEHGLFIGMADEALLGTPGGGVEIVTA